MNSPSSSDENREAEDLMLNENLEIVAQRSTEIAATVLVNVLADAGIRAVAVGGFTAGFRTEAPGWVQVKTLERDAERARQIISEVIQVESENPDSETE
ncbi:Putative signal transducing protein [Neorhodopirellula lusitana]|uniref:Signal transducing protein n=1 Tax=Neorhodopirellula lusitana TaxID=445327 RepID=A0ABY1QPV0_9BACT|nr:DUF2007 domain-containing protein [Neorhodopirellula lusitana]SMP76596.1 Putative signal transducing protein [Neorhodopirellula lusitana]